MVERLRRGRLYAEKAAEGCWEVERCGTEDCEASTVADRWVLQPRHCRPMLAAAALFMTVNRVTAAYRRHTAYAVILH